MMNRIPKEYSKLIDIKGTLSMEAREGVVNMCNILIDKRRDELEHAQTPNEVFTLQGNISELRRLIKLMQSKD